MQSLTVSAYFAAVSGGLDCKLLHWDTDSRNLVSSRSVGSEGPAESRVTNPPMIHNLAVAPTTDCPAAQLVAAACGDGTLVVWDLDKGLSTANKRTRARQRQPECVLGKGDVGHRAAATCVRFTDDSAQRLISGGNDRQLLIWQTTWQTDSANSSHNESCIHPVVKLQHTRKIHALAWHAEHVYVADTSRHVSVYHVP